VDSPACTLPTAVEGSHSSGSSVPGEAPRSPASNAHRATRPEAEETSAASSATSSSSAGNGQLSLADFSRSRYRWTVLLLTLQIRGDLPGQGGIRSRDAGLNVNCRMGNLFSGKMFSFDFRKTSAGITSDTCSGPGPLSPLRCIWTTITFHVAAIAVVLGHRSIRLGPRLRYCGATITVETQNAAHITTESRPTSQRNPVAHIQWNHRPTSTVIRNVDPNQVFGEI